VRKRDGAAAEASLAGSGSRLVNTKDITTGESALHIVTRGRDLLWLRFLLAKGARPDLPTKDGDTALILATQLGWIDGATELLSRGAKVDASNGRGETPLILAVHKRDVSLIRLFVANGANPRRTDRVAGYSALDYAKRDDRSGALVRLLETAQPVKAVAGPPR
jgi:ankyrin repeat protein